MDAAGPTSPTGLERVRVALLTPPGRGALAVVGIAGRGGCTLADRRFRPRGGLPLAERPDRSIAVGTWHAADDQPGEELVVVRQADDRLEVHCHGGVAAAEAVLASLVALGAVREPWPVWLAATGARVLDVEARQALALAAGPRAARILSRQLAAEQAGVIPSPAGTAASAGPEGHTAAETAGGASGLRLLRAARVGLRLTEPWRVVVAGPVNAGKSSLVNALAGHARSIVTPQPGTTRDLVTTRVVLGGWEVELIDTAGERPPGEAVSATEQAGIALAADARARADLVLAVAAVDDSPPRAAGPRELVVLTKADLGAAPAAVPAGGVVTSAVTGVGIDELAAAIVAALVPEDVAEPGLLDGPVPFTERQVEAIRTERLQSLRT